MVNRVSRHARRAAGLVIAAAVCLDNGTGTDHPIFASTAIDYVVTKTADTNDGACTVGDCSLREAIIAANANAGADRVVLGRGLTYQLTIAPLVPFGPANGDLDITDALTIDGNGSTVDAGGIDRVFNILAASTVTIDNLTVTNGAPAGFLALGGGILVRTSALILNNSTVSANSTADSGGGIAAVGAYDAPTMTATLASVTLNNSTVSGNEGLNGGGIVCVLCTLTASSSSRVASNVATGDGGGVNTVGHLSSVSMTSSSLLQNQSLRGGGLSVPFGSSVSTLSRNRIVSNLAATGGAIFNNLGSVNAINNWWGCSYAPGTTGAGCAGATNDTSGAASASPHLVLKASAMPQIVPVKGSTAVSADLRFNSASEDTSGGGTVPDGVPAAFAETTSLGTFAAGGSTTTGGKATDVYTAGSSTGVATIQATVDGQQAATTVTIVAPPAVDLNADGTGDVFTYGTSTGIWKRQVSQGDGSFVETGASGNQSNWVPGWSILPAKFDNDNHTDFFLFNPTNGNWFKVLNDGASGFIAQAGGQWWNGWQRFVMDLNGDGVSDIFLYDPVSGAWWKCVATPTGFDYTSGAWNPNWEITPVTLNTDALTDLFLFERSTGSWYWVLGEVGPSFTYPSAGYWTAVWNLYPGDFNADGLSDLLLHDPASGAWYVAMNNALGTGFTYTGGYWVLGWTPYVGDLDADGDADLFLHNSSNGVWYEVLSDGAGGFTAVGTSQWVTGWNIYMTDLNGDSRTDLLLYNPSTGVWYQARNLTLGTFAYSTGNWAPDLQIIVRTPFF